MCSVIKHVKKDNDDAQCQIIYEASDVNESLIKMWKEFQAKSFVKLEEAVTKQFFEDLKYDPASSSLKGFVGHVCTFAGLYFQHYETRYSGMKELNNKYDEFKMISKMLEHVHFSMRSYDDIPASLSRYVIYCDPPYAKHSRYYNENNTRRKFDNQAFWYWCILMSKNNIVLVSEFSIPEFVDHNVILERQYHTQYSKSSSMTSEKLYHVVGVKV